MNLFKRLCKRGRRTHLNCLSHWWRSRKCARCAHKRVKKKGIIPVTFFRRRVKAPRKGISFSSTPFSHPMASLASTFTRISSAARTVAQPCRAILTPNQLGVFKMHQHGFPTFTKLKTIGATRAFQSSVSMAKNPRSSSWGDMIPSPHQSSSSSENPISKIILSRPQYKRFGQQGPNGSQNGRGRGPPIFYDKRFQVVGGVVTVGAGGYYVTHLET